MAGRATLSSSSLPKLIRPTTVKVRQSDVSEAIWGGRQVMVMSKRGPGGSRASRGVRKPMLFLFLFYFTNLFGTSHCILGSMRGFRNFGYLHQGKQSKKQYYTSA